MSDAISKALKTAFELGKTYWMQADSQSFAEQRRSDETVAKFRALESSTLQALQSGEPVAWHISKDPDGDQSSHVTADGEFASSYAQMGWKVSPLYTTPQPAVPEGYSEMLVEYIRDDFECVQDGDEWCVIDLEGQEEQLKYMRDHGLLIQHPTYPERVKVKALLSAGKETNRG